MAANSTTSGSTETHVITVRYWAAARSAAGVDQDELRVDGPITLAEVLERALRLHRGTRLPEVVALCSVLVGDRPVATEEPERVQVLPGESVELLPPFAGG